MEELRIKIKLDFKDFLNFQYWHLRKKLLTRYTILGIFLLATALISIVLLDALPSIERGPLVSIFTFVIILPTILIVGTYNASKKHFNNDLQLQKDQEYIFDSSGMQFSTENSQTKLTWEELFKFEESKKNLLIYCSPLKCFIIPKIQISESEILFIRNKLTSNVKSKNSGTNSVFPLKFRIALYVIPVVIGVVIGLYPNKSNEYFEKGYAKAEQEDYEGAIIEYTKAIEEDPYSAKAYTQRGYAKGMIGNFTGELEDCSKAIDLDKMYALAYYNRGDAKYFLNDSIGACNDFYKALKLGYKDADEVIEDYCK